MNIAGVDPSSKRLAVVGETKGRYWTAVHEMRASTNRYAPYVAASAFRFMSKVLQHRSVDEVWLEEPVVGRAGVYATLVQAYVNGAVQAACSLAGVNILLVNNATWKKQVIGSGKADKTAIADWVKKHHRKTIWPLVQDDPDLPDAAAIFVYGHERPRRRVA